MFLRGEVPPTVEPSGRGGLDSPRNQLPRRDLKTCRQCKRHSDECGPISHSRLCLECGLFNQTQNILEVADGIGPMAERRLRRTIMAANRQLLAIQRDNT